MRLEVFGADLDAPLSDGGDHLFEDLDAALEGAIARDSDDGAVGLDGDLDGHVDDARGEDDFDQPGAGVLGDGTLDHGIGNFLECLACGGDCYILFEGGAENCDAVAGHI